MVSDTAAKKHIMFFMVSVLILVLMEHGLGDVPSFHIQQRSAFLILVLMEYGLGGFKAPDGKVETKAS